MHHENGVEYGKRGSRPIFKKVLIRDQHSYPENIYDYGGPRTGDPGSGTLKYPMVCSYLSASAGAHRCRGPAGVLHLHAAGQHPETLRHFLVTDPPEREGARIKWRQRAKE
jgi:hypothetical protein